MHRNLVLTYTNLPLGVKGRTYFLSCSLKCNEGRTWGSKGPSNIWRWGLKGLSEIWVTGSAGVCMSVGLYALECQNYQADFNKIFYK